MGGAEHPDFGSRLRLRSTRAPSFCRRIATRLQRRRVRIRMNDQHRQWYRDHDMVLIVPSIGTSLVNCRIPVVRGQPITNRTYSQAPDLHGLGDPGGKRGRGDKRAAITSSRSCDIEIASRDRPAGIEPCFLPRDLKQRAVTSPWPMTRLYDEHTFKPQLNGEFQPRHDLPGEILFSLAPAARRRKPLSRSTHLNETAHVRMLTHANQ